MGTLNVIMHGLWAMVEEPYRVVLATPFVNEHDKYFIQVQGDGVNPETNGSRLRYGRGNYELIGVNAGPRSGTGVPPVFPVTQNASIGSGSAHYTDVFTTAPPAYAAFVMPRPKNVIPCQCFNLNTDLIFAGKDAAQISSQKFARIIVLVYDFDDVNQVRFLGLPGLKARYRPGTCVDDPKFVNIAIIARGNHPTSSGVSQAFDQMMKDIIPGKDIRLVPINPSAKPPLECDIPGTDPSTFMMFEFSPTDFSVDDCIGLAINNG